jgi:uncharacterized protein (TIGR02145 family)
MKSVKKILFLLILIFVIINLNAQTGLNFQGVARTSNNVILASQAITIKLSISRGNINGTKTEEYVETRKVTTNAQGLFTVVIGDTGAISTLGNFATINWKLIPKFLKIEMDPTAGNNFINMGTTQFQYVAYAQFAKSVEAENIVGILPISSGGTGVNSIAELKTALAIDKLNNTADTSKPISVLIQASLDTKLNKSDTSKYTKKTYTDSSLLTKLSLSSNAATATTAATATKLVTARNINGVSFDGSADITVNADAATLTGTTLKSTVTGSSLTSVGTLANLTVTNPILGSVTGAAAIATKLATARNINGVSFDGTTDIIVNADAGTLTGTTLNATITGSSLTSVGTLANLTVTNPIEGSITGNAATATTATTAGTSTTTTGNAGTATKLATSRTINGVAFDGTGDITVNADAGTLTGTTLKSTVTSSSLTSVGTLANLTVTNPIVGSITGNAATATNIAAVFLPTVVIGTQQWMEKNLDVLTYRNGDLIPEVTDPSAWESLTTGAWCYYDNDPLNGAIYGKLYNWYAVNDPRGLAPQGWHIASDPEWDILYNKLGWPFTIGDKMKTTGNSRWGIPSWGTNESGFSGLPGGFRSGSGDNGVFRDVGATGNWWTSTLEWSRYLKNGDGTLSRRSVIKTTGFSVRCIRD